MKTSTELCTIDVRVLRCSSATVRTVDRTGVEMEALAAVAAGCLTVYDMLKRYERGMRIEAVELVEKSGGRSGLWRRGAAPPRGESPGKASAVRRALPRARPRR